MLDEIAVKKLKNAKNLLAFSHGVDSTALFYLLEKNALKFDLAFVNYNTRKESSIEETSARNLAFKFNKQIYVKQVKFSLDSSNFEKIAREIRYEFFYEICSKFGYTNLITAHQLNDKFEWFLMRLSKGSGLANLISMDAVEQKNSYTIVRPLINTSRNELLDFLNSNNIKYFIDSSNLDTNFERNFIRVNFSDEFVAKFSSGLKKSFEFLAKDREILLNGEIYSDSEFFIIKNNPNAINLVDKALKTLGVVMSQKQRLQAMKDSVISGKVAIGYTDDRVFIAPYKTPVMDKKFKEKCRIKKIPPLIRGYIYTRKDLLEIC
ncbi:tRNA lysidine(34) synthetase TilS [Campylobacter corcagiensis]|uniref:tRNA(Ile)-lysidine synthase n=1 Tax=Campylobacter corcagiensis TaxID=1448857 RepID=A0A7M1LH42_9BACT|nr:tRNA lysidine(34) synthetase TilS [Campylobacter corcagiensis]QKF64142.1 tRNA(Ile)-lysidine synthetase [Campylobacter corcagiensis]QOQ87663.1 tRNA lysidine(34) synthetase TilS [Campylobacter corcagiensis]